MAGYTPKHNIFYPAANDLIKDPNSLAKLAQDIQNTAQTIDAAITAEGARAEEAAYERARWKKGLIPENVDIREFLYGKDGQFEVQNANVTRTQTGLPQDLIDSPSLYTAVVETTGAGTVIKLTVYSVFVVAEYTCTSAPPSTSGDGWTRWYKVQYERPDTGKAKTGTVRPGVKNAATPLNSPTGPYNVMSMAQGRLRLPMLFTFNSTRCRIHIQNHNWRSNTKYAGAVNFTGIWWGRGVPKSGSFATAPTQLLGAFTTPEDGGEWVSPWFNIPDIKNVYTLLSVGFNGAPAELVESRAGCWRDTNTGNAGSTSFTGAMSTTSPFHIWVEFEVSAETPVGMVLGSSGEAGTGSAIPLFQTGFQYYCRMLGAVPMVWAQSGTTMQQWEDGEHAKWTQFEKYAKPDFAVVTVGQNDTYSDTISLELMQQRMAKIVQNIRDGYTDNIFLTTIPPRAVAGDETKRRAYNGWMNTRPLGILDVFDVSGALSLDDTVLNPAYDADGVHANELGGMAKAQALAVRPMTYDRAGASRSRVLTHANLASGSVLITRVGKSIRLYGDALKFSGVTGNISLNDFIPAGFRAEKSVVWGPSLKYWTSDTSNPSRVAGNALQVLTVDANTQINLDMSWHTEDPMPFNLVEI